MHAKDRLATRAVGRLDGDTAVEPPGTKKRLVEYVRSVRGGDDDDARRGIESVHLGQDLVQRLLALVVAAAVAGNAARPRAADRVQLVDEHDRRSVRLRLLEQVPHPRGAYADDRFDELRGGHRVEGNVRLAGDRAREQCLACPGRAGEENAVRDPAAEAPVLVGVAQEVDDLAQLVLRLLDAGDVRERHLVARGHVATRPGASERAERVLHIPGATEQPEEQADEQDRRAEAEEQRLPPGRPGVERLGVDRDVVLLQHLGELVGVRKGGDLGPEPRRRLRVLVRHRLLERALDVRSLGGDLRDVAGFHLLEEQRAVRDAHPGSWLHRPAAEEEVQRQQDDEEGDPAAARAVPRALGATRSRAGRGRRRRLLRLVRVGGHAPTLLRSRLQPHFGARVVT